MSSIDDLCINTIRFLAVDAIEKANSGHPGMPMGAAPMGYLLFDRFMRYSPEDPDWFDRDRFVLSAGHGSMLLYALLHLTGYDLPMAELQQFRRWESMTPGHPEYGETPGVETTTGPLGQGVGNAIGMAITEAFLAATFNRPHGSDEDFGLVDHHTYVICSDGDLMEGVASEAASLAGHLRPGKLICLYDDNHISIEGSTDLAFTEDVPRRFEAYGWHVQVVSDGNDLVALDAAVHAAQAESGKPSLIAVRTHIAYGSPMQDDAEAHGAALGPDNVAATKENLGWPPAPAFHVPDEVREHLGGAVERGRQAKAEWRERLERCRERFPEHVARFEQVISGVPPDGWEDSLPVFRAEDGAIATRNASGDVLNAIRDALPTLIGGSADLAPSTKTLLADEGDFSAEHRTGRNFHFGVREHGMGAIVNGMALHGGVIPYGATFLVFSDYMRGSVRLSAIMGCDSTWVFTHDSIGVGEDGPTHQPVEQVMSLRLIPNLTVFRPADANETAIAWRLAIERPGPAALALSRQKLPTLDPEQYPVREGALRGAYVLAEATGGRPRVIIIATGSEVALALEAREALQADGIATRVVSMPCWEIFAEQPEAYRAEVLPPDIPKLAVEAGATLGWERWVGDGGDVIGIDRFGASAPGDTVMDKLGFNVPNVVARARRLANG